MGKSCVRAYKLSESVKEDVKKNITDNKKTIQHKTYHRISVETLPVVSLLLVFA